VGTHAVEPGTVLADRYVVEDLLAEEGDSRSWRARDKILARSVVLQVLPSSSPYAAAMLTAAKRAARVGDPRILQVLDAVDDGSLAYVVREWATGQSLDVVLSEGPLGARRATWVMREVAAAIAGAHRLGMAHRRLAPDTIVITKSSGVKVIGLGTFAALQEFSGEDSEREDMRDLGRLLYACLTARWPGGPVAGLPAAPTEHGRLLRPRQVRAGVPRALDAICDRILADQPRVGEPITTAGEMCDALSLLLATNGFESTGSGLSAPPIDSRPRPVEPPPAVWLPDDATPPGADQPAFVPPIGRDDGDDKTSLGRTLMWTVVAVLLAGAVLLAYLIGQNGLRSGGSPPPASSGGPTSASSSPPATHPLRIAAVQDFDPPPGSGEENHNEVGLAVDGDPGTAWQTLRYQGDPHLGGLKSGVGLVVDLGSVQRVTRVALTIQGIGTNLQLRAAASDATSMPSASADQYRLVKTVSGAGRHATVALQPAVRTRYLLVWLTSLPGDGPGFYRGGIAEIEVSG
jgi:putative peptidoglycan lipid II flippase